MKILQFWQKKLFLVLDADEQQSDGGPDEFADADEQRHYDAGVGGEAQTSRRHEEASLATAQL